MLGFVFSMREYILFLNGLTPLHGLLVYYAVLGGSLFVLSRMDLVVFGFKIRSLTQTLGLMLITFAFFVVVGWSSPYVQYVATGSTAGASVVFYQCEDGAVWYVWSTLLPTLDVEVLRILSFVLTPFLLVLAGGMLVAGRIRMGDAL